MIKNTPLYANHLALGARIIEFGGWNMPLNYGSQIQEHLDVRNDAGVFDVSHMLAIDIIGNDVIPFLRYLLANDISKLKEVGKALYTCMLNIDAGIKDDLIVYRLGEDRFRLVVNAGTRDKDLAWFQMHQVGFNISILPLQDWGILAIQGPNAWSKMRNIFSETQNEATQQLKPFFATEIGNWMIAKTGYTGEEGMEIILPHQEMVSFWQQILEQEIRPIGLGARDSLRLEAGYNLYGQDMDETVSPLESNLLWTVDLKDKGRNFIGKEALLKQQETGQNWQLEGVVLLSDGVCRSGMDLYTQHNEICGKITSGGFSPTLSCGIGLARIKTKSIPTFVMIRDKKIPAKIIKPPFVKQSKPNFTL